MREPVVPARDCATALTVERADIRSPEALALIGALNAELSTRYPEDGATHFRLDAEEVAPGRGGSQAPGAVASLGAPCFYQVLR